MRKRGEKRQGRGLGLIFNIANWLIHGKLQKTVNQFFFFSALG